MSVIGENIKKYRTAKGITQEQLGQLVGVTTQAVSKWERGGTPDAEILPSLSQVLEVSIDALFGREEKSIASFIARKLCQLPEKEAFRYAFDICWAIEMGLLQDISAMDDFFGMFVDRSAITADSDGYFAKIIRDGGLSTVRLSKDFHHFFLMVEPEESIKDNIADPESIRKVFELFSDKRIIKIIFYMYSRLNTPIATSLISKCTGIEMSEADKCLEILCENRLATRNTVDTADGQINTYMFHQESSVIPLLCYADEITKKVTRDFICTFDRTKPLL